MAREKQRVSRRRFLARCGGLATVAITGGASKSAMAQSGSGTGTAWPMHRGDVGNTAAISTTISKDSVQEQWRVNFGDEPLGPPTVVDGTVYVGSENGTLYALDVATGDRQWVIRADDSITTAPAVVNGTVYFGSDDSNIYAVSAADGSEQWSVSFGLPIRASPTVVGDTVYGGGQNGDVFALDAATGEENWSYKVNEPVYSGAAVVGGNVYAVSVNGTVYGLDAGDGQRYWEVALQERVRAPPTVADGTVYVAAEDSVYALATRFGEELWSKNIPVRASSPLAVSEDRVAISGSDGLVYVLSPETGAERFRFGTGALGSNSPIFADGILCFGAAEEVRAIDATTSAQYWSFSVESGEAPSLAIVDNTVYITDRGGNLYALDAGTQETNSTASATPTSTTSATATPTSTPTADAASGATSTPASTETPTPTPTPMPVSTSGSSGSALPFNSSPMELLGIGGAAAGTLLVGYTLYRRGDSTAGTDQPATDAESGADSGAETDADSTTDVNVSGGETAAAGAAKDSATEGEIPEAVEGLLAAAEVDMENAISAFVNGDTEIAQVRFQQATDRYERALDHLDDAGVEQLLLSVDVSTDETIPEFDSFDAVPGIDADMADALREAGYDGPADVRALSTGELTDIQGIDEEYAGRLKAASWQTPGDQQQFESRRDIVNRLAAAEEGYQAC